MAAGPSGDPINPGQFTYFVAASTAAGYDQKNR
jgi:hypothetical protein